MSTALHAFPPMTEPTEQLYGWWSEQHEQAFPGSACIYETPDGRKVQVTNVNDSSTDPDGYKWPDARCVGPVTKYLRMSDRAKKISREWRQIAWPKSIHQQVPPAWRGIFQAIEKSLK
jgi:hypothetical protein